MRTIKMCVEIVAVFSLSCFCSCFPSSTFNLNNESLYTIDMPYYYNHSLDFSTYVFRNLIHKKAMINEIEIWMSKNKNDPTID